MTTTKIGSLILACMLINSLAFAQERPLKVKEHNAEIPSSNVYNDANEPAMRPYSAYQQDAAKTYSQKPSVKAYSNDAVSEAMDSNKQVREALARNPNARFTTVTKGGITYRKLIRGAITPKGNGALLGTAALLTYMASESDLAKIYNACEKSNSTKCNNLRARLKAETDAAEAAPLSGPAKGGAK